jgi:outer membrane immunogenic protein
MKNLLTAALLASVSSVAANAADMSMPYKAAPPQSVYNWTGFYIGGNVGGGFANSEHLDADVFSASNTKFQEAFGTVGVGAGYNYQFGHTVLGIEGDYNWANVDKTKDILSPFRLEEALISAAAVLPSTNTTRFQMNEFATIRARAGLALDRTLVYATAGLAFGHIKNTTALGAGGFSDQASEDKWKTGLAVGGGVEYALTQNWTIRGEYLLMQFQNSDADFNQVGGRNDGRPSCSNTFPCRMNYSESIQTARIGVNYKFGN